MAATLALSGKGSEDREPYTSQLVPHYETFFAIWQKGDKLDIDRMEFCRIWHTYAWQALQARSQTLLQICSELLKQTQELCHNHAEQPSLTAAMNLLGVAHLSDGNVNEAFYMLLSVVKLRDF